MELQAKQYNKINLMYIVLADTYMDPENNSLQFILTHLLLMQSPLKLYVVSCYQTAVRLYNVYKTF